MSTTSIPAPTLRRLPAYFHYLKGLQQHGVKVVSCSKLGQDLSLDPTQIRKDFEITTAVGKPKVGYVVPDLLKAIETFLGWDITKDAFLAGAGSLGRALLTYENLKQFGLNITRVFDLDQPNIGQWIHGLEVLPVGYLPDLTRRLGVEIGIITLPAVSAQAAADLMVKGGMKAIWNFAPVALRVPSDVIVQNEDFYYSIAALSCKLARRSPPHTPGGH